MICKQLVRLWYVGSVASGARMYRWYWRFSTHFPVFFIWLSLQRSVHIRSFSGPCFPAFGLKAELISIFSPNAGKYRPEKFQIRTLFTQCECVPLTISYQLYFLHISVVWSMLHHRSVGQVQSKECCFMFRYTFLSFFVGFHQKLYVFIIFISFFYEVSNFHNRILTKQKPELLIRNCQWNCTVYTFQVAALLEMWIWNRL